MFTAFDSLINYNYYQEIGMGCGAVCGNNSSIYEPNQYSQKIVQNLIPQLKHSKDFISPKQYNSFIRQIKQNPLKYRLRVASKLVPKQQIDPGILTKWKVILYCLQCSNSHYNNCLGQKPRKVASEKQAYQCIDNEQSSQQEQYELNLSQSSTLFQHKQFKQIEKDIDRTCDLSDQKKKKFQKILKRITNHFPQMGYTQGINFIIGYLLTIGYSQFDAFWMFVYIAINPRYLLLGLFEDGFPLSEIYKNVFRNILKRKNTLLYQHLYQHLNIDESVWVFKWFITYFIYSFPHQMIKYVFDIVIELGGIGLIAFAVAITLQLSTYLLKENDVCDISLFFQSLRDVNVFNEYLSINKIIETAYTLQFRKEDFTGIDGLNKNFYTEFILASIENSQDKVSEPLIKKIQVPQQDKKKAAFVYNTLQNSLLDEWYQKLIKERISEINKFQNNQTQPIDLKKEKPSNPRISLQNQLKIMLSEQEEQKFENIIKSPEKAQSSKNSNQNSIKDSLEIKNDTIPSTGYSFNKKGSQIHNKGPVSQIDELWEQQDQNSSVSKNLSSKMSQQSRTQNGFHLSVRKTSYEDELDKLASTQGNPLGKVRNNSYRKSSSIFNEDKKTSFKPKINNFQIPSQNNKGSRLARAAEHILSNLSINEHSQHESSNSQYSKFSQKEKKSKQNDLYGKNYYKSKSKKQISLNQNETQTVIQLDKKSHDQNSSSVDSYLDPHNSFCISNESIQEQIKNNEIQSGSVRAFESHRQRMNTHQDMFTTSLNASHIKQMDSKDVAQSHVSQIQIFQAPQQVFKKKNRVSSRINGAQRQAPYQALKIPKLNHTISDADIVPKQKSFKTIQSGKYIEQTLNYEQSYESIFVPSQGKKSNTFRFHQQLKNCQVESVK